MEYISFYKDRLPFKPKSTVVIYFDVMGVKDKFFYITFDRYYEYILETFQHGGHGEFHHPPSSIS